MRYLPLLMTLPFVIACSTIFEDRSVCPCILTLYPDTEGEKIAADMTVWCFDEDMNIQHYIKVKESDTGKPLEIPLKREKAHIAVWGNISPMSSVMDSMTCKSAIHNLSEKNMDRLLSYLKTIDIDADKESVSDTVSFRKEYIPVKIKLTGGYKPEEIVLRFKGAGDTIMTDRSGTYGYSELKPEGIAEEGNAVYRFNIYRQSAISSLEMEITAKSQDLPARSHHIHLGKILEEGKYDTTRDNPEPITLEFALDNGFIKLTVGGWIYTDKADITI